ncbi:MAG: DUF2236 domain-containing protein [Actinobacteria bacterium]|nr:DUF2236 domain-containing protein [Actinomycetota bacterium]MCB9389352.1 DUF2236 domain-containing protein [Acidimicrobiia bacterium]
MLLLPTPTSLAYRVLPYGIPVVRQEFLDRTGIFKSTLDRNATPGDPGLFGPRSATWELTGHVSIALAGVRAALLQALSVSIPTATHSTGAFYEDFLGRVERTGAFVQAQNLGSMNEVYRTARRVRAMHRVVKGEWKDGTEYDATDPHQTAWVSMTLTDSILVMYERFGRGPVPQHKADEFVRQQSIHDALLDHRVNLDEVFNDPDQRRALQAGTLPLPLIEEGELPTTREQLAVYMQRFTPELSLSRLTRALIDAAVTLDTMPEAARQMARVFVLATLSTMPDEWHDLIAPGSSRLQERLASEAVQLPLALLQAIVGELPSLRIAKARVRAGAPQAVAA